MKLMLVLFLSLLGFSAHANMASQATEILSYFGASCSINGDWAKGAISNAQKLVKVMENLRDDKSCKTVAGTISDITNLQAYVEKVQTESGQKELMALTREEQVLLLSLSSTTDPSELAVISAELRENQLQQSKYAALNDYNNSATKKSQEAMETLVVNTDAFLSTLNANQTCLQNNTGMLTDIASMVASVVSSVLPTYGPMIKAGVKLTGQMVEFARINRINRHIKKTSMGIASTAYQCALETFSDQWCNADDTARAIELKLVPPINPETDDMWIGLKILDVDLPSLLGWLKKVRAGSPPTTALEAERQNRASRREQRVIQLKRSSQGIITENTEQFNDAVTPESKWPILRKTIGLLVSEVMNDKDPSAMAEVYDSAYSPYFLLGLSRSEAPKSNGYILEFSAFDPFTMWPSSQQEPFKPDLDKIAKAFEAWNAQAELNMQREILQVLQVSPLEVMDDAINNDGKLATTPRKAIGVILNFMKLNMPEKFVTTNHKKIYDDTILLLTSIAKNIDAVHQDIGAKDPLKALGEISSLAQLRFGTVLIDSRVTRTIRFALNEIVLKRAGNSNDITSQFLAADDIVKSIKRISPNVDLMDTLATIDNSKSISQGSAEAFASLFGRSIRKSLEEYDRLAKAAKNNGEKSYNENMKAHLCIKLFTVDKWPKKVPFELCEGSQLKNIHPKGPQTIVLTKAAMEMSFEERVCTYRNFRRRNFIFQQYMNRISRSKSLKSH